jgi:uncharacterized protein YndB with AHSA1/START domain
MSTIDDTQKAHLSYRGDNELVITRDFSAPRELVFAAISQPEHVRQWYGMSESSMLVCEIDFRVGGRWHYVLAGEPGGENHSFSGEYLEIDAPSRIVSTEGYDNLPGASYVASVTLEETEHGTRLRTHLRYPSTKVRDGHVGSGMENGMNISFNRLDALLQRMAG